MGKSPEQTLPLSSEDSWDIKKWGDNDCHGDKYTWLSHAYNPITQKSWDNKELYDSLINDGTEYDHALQRSIILWKNMIKFRNSSDAQENRLTYFTLGRLCHLVQDMTSPAHVHADFHGTGDDAEEYAEKYIDEIMNRLPPLEIKKPTTHGLRIEHPYREDLRKADNIFYFMKHLAFKTYFMTSYYGGELIREVGDVQPDSELKRMFPYNNGKGLRYDPGGYMKDAYIIDNVGYLWPNGEKNNDWWPCPEDPGYYYLEEIDGWVIGGEAIPQVFKSKQHSFERIDATNLDSLEPNTLPLPKLYAERLFPLAVEWTAGLLQSLYPQVTGPKNFEKKACKCRPLDLFGIDGMPSELTKKYHQEREKLRRSLAKEDCTCYFEEGEWKHCDSRFGDPVFYCN
ncbi:MAG: hypothetical protein D3906_01355 [Candidatus Electrothrix sp. AUS1_2]|nr:hypothetical protein [Candidatus Electrothrix sp. AUS1_2]